MHLLKTEAISTSNILRLKMMQRADLSIIDEVVFLMISRAGGKPVLSVNIQVLCANINHSNIKGFDEWPKFLGGPIIAITILDRLVHKCKLFNMTEDSHRLTHSNIIL